MKQKSWHLNRRDLLKGGGVALALPLLNGMSWANEGGKDLPKRMLVSYFAYGAYMPNGASGVPAANKPHHEWSWWPCSTPGPLSFNKSSAPFESLKDDLSYLRGLDHKGGWKMGGHSSGDVFATGADMTEHEKTNNISIDQVAARQHGHKTRYPCWSWAPKAARVRTDRAKHCLTVAPAVRFHRCISHRKSSIASSNRTPAKASNRCEPTSSGKPAFWI